MKKKYDKKIYKWRNRSDSYPVFMCCINWIHKHTLLKWPRKISLYSLAFLWRYFLHLCFNLQVWKNIKWRKSGIMNLIFIFEECSRQLYWRLVCRSWVIEYRNERQQLFDARHGVKKWCQIWHRVVVKFLMPDMTLKIWRPFYVINCPISANESSNLCIQITTAGTCCNPVTAMLKWNRVRINERYTAEPKFPNHTQLTLQCKKRHIHVQKPTYYAYPAGFCLAY